MISIPNMIALRKVSRFLKRCPYRGAGVLFVCDDPDEGPMVLLGRRRYRWERNRWAIPGGGKKTRETFEECAQREADQEFGRLHPEPEFAREVRQRVPGIFEWSTFIARLPSRPDRKLWPVPECYHSEFYEVGWFPLKRLPHGTSRLLTLWTLPQCGFARDLIEQEKSRC